MKSRRLLLIGVAVAGLAAAGTGVTSVMMDLPQDAVPVQDPVGDALRDHAAAPTPDSARPAPQVHVEPPAPVVADEPDVTVAAVQEDLPEDLDDEEEAVEEAPAGPVGLRQRRPVAIVHAVNKMTTESMSFEVPVGGRPIRFDKILVFSARACEVTASDELQGDHIAYLEVGVQPRGAINPLEIRQIFKGWMFASSPAINGLQHPVYDAWVIGCKA